jgi:hypothetical protein
MKEELLLEKQEGLLEEEEDQDELELCSQRQS